LLLFSLEKGYTKAYLIAGEEKHGKIKRNIEKWMLFINYVEGLMHKV
jgi:hypothetical protein